MMKISEQWVACDLVKVVIEVLKPNDLEQPTEERVCLAFISQITVHWGQPRQELKLDRNMEAGADAETM